MVVVALVNKKTYVVCTKAQQSRYDTTTRHFIFLCFTMAKLVDFDTTISNSFLGQILVKDAEIHRERQLWAPIEFVSRW